MKIISYAIYGEENFYKKGLLKNIDIAKEFFNDWILQIRISDKIDHTFIKSLESKNTDIYVMEDSFSNRALWRFLPMESNHDVVIVRDVDTRLLDRDKILLDDWLNSNYKYHICRDNPGSENVILGGLWGGKKPNLKIQKYWKKWINEEDQKHYVWDIGFLKRYVYPQMRNDLIVYTENVFYEGETTKTIPGDRGIFDGRKKMIGMYYTQDIDKEDDKKNDDYINFFGQSKNFERRDMIEQEKKFDFSKKIYFIPKYIYINKYLNNLYLFLDFLILRLVLFKKYKSFLFLYQFIKRRLFKEHKNKNDITIYK